MIDFKVKSNISQFLRELGVITRGKNSIYNLAGRALIDALFNEFKDMVYDTPQWTGTTAASWHIGFDADSSVNDMGDPNKIQYWKGHQEACMVSIGGNTDFLSSDPKRVLYRDIIINNEAEGFESSEYGPVRYVNDPAGPLGRFEGRVGALNIVVDFLGNK